VQLQPGQTSKLTAKAVDASGAALSGPPVRWTSSNAALATVDDSGMVRGVSPGTATVTVTVDGKSASAVVTVVRVPVSSVSVSLDAASRTVGQSAQARVTAYDASGQALSGRTFTWSSSNTAVATVSSSGAVSAMGSGTALITATSEGVSGSATVAVSAPPVVGVDIYPGESIQAKVDAAAPGTTFVLKAGTHLNQSVVPKSGNVFVGEAGTVLDGGGRTLFAFGRGTATSLPANVVIRKLEIRNYGPTSTVTSDYYGVGAITAGGPRSVDGTRGWVVDSNYIHDNRGPALWIGHTMLVRGNRMLRNAGPYALSGIGDSTLILNTELADGNYLDRFDPGFGAGGFKFVLSTGLVVRGNWIHNNHGFGAWGDIANRSMTFDGNTVEDNTHAGIFYEISYGCTVTNNVVRRNGLGDAASWLYPAGILIAHSPDCEVANNTVEGNVHGIIGIQQNRTGDAELYGPHELRNLWVHDNIVVQTTGYAAGVSGDYGTASLWSAWNNRFDRNRYTVPTSNGWPFSWKNAGQTWAQWRAYSEDVAGTFGAR
jgi:parallel beta-helix repeat protein